MHVLHFHCDRSKERQKKKKQSKMLAEHVLKRKRRAQHLQQSGNLGRRSVFLSGGKQKVYVHSANKTKPFLLCGQVNKAVNAKSIFCYLHCCAINVYRFLLNESHLAAINTCNCQ